MGTVKVNKARGRNRHKINSKRVVRVRDMEERDVGTKGKSPKQGLASAENLTIELPEDATPLQ